MISGNNHIDCGTVSYDTQEMPVTIPAIGSMLLGTVFGQFFKVWILVLVLALVFVIVLSSSVS